MPTYASQNKLNVDIRNSLIGWSTLKLTSKSSAKSQAPTKLANDKYLTKPFIKKPYHFIFIVVNLFLEFLD